MIQSLLSNIIYPIKTEYKDKNESLLKFSDKLIINNS